MKTTWVLTDEERKQKFEGRGERKSSSTDSCGGEEGRGEESSTSSTSRKVTLSGDELGVVDSLVKASDYWEQSKVNDMDTALIRQIIRMVAFRANLDESGQEQLKHLMSERTRRFAGSLADFQGLSCADREEILAHNLPVVMMLKTCSFFHPQLEWTHQLAPLLGVGEVEKLDVKLRSLNVSGTARFGVTLQFSFSIFFCFSFKFILLSCGSFYDKKKKKCSPKCFLWFLLFSSCSFFS